MPILQDPSLSVGYFHSGLIEMDKTVRAAAAVTNVKLGLTSVRPDQQNGFHLGNPFLLDKAYTYSQLAFALGYVRVWLLESLVANRKAATLADAYGLGAFAVHLTLLGHKIGNSAKQQSILGIFVITNSCRVA